MTTNLISETLTEELDRELTVTRTMLERIPEDKFEYAPHPKSMTLLRLATHITNLLNLQRLILEDDFRDTANRSTLPPTPGSLAELLTRFDTNAANLRKTLNETSDNIFETGFQMRAGDKILMDRPKSYALRIMGFNHSIHHRGQLSVYLRLLDVSVPGIYGPSADESGTF